MAEKVERAVGQHLVDVHVGGGAGAALEGVHHHLRGQGTLRHLAAGRLDGIGLGLIGPDAESAVGAGAGELHGAVRAHQLGVDRTPGEREVGGRARGMDALRAPPAGTATSPSASRSTRLYGENIPPHPTNWVAENGVMIYDRAFSIRDISRRHFNTLMVAENSRFPVLAGDQWINGLNIMDGDYAINYIPADPRLWEHDIRSEHPGGQRRALRRFGPVPQRNDGCERPKAILRGREERW